MEKIQIIKCRGCGSAFAACLAPECYIEKVWLSDLKKALIKGNEIDLVLRKDFKLEECKCKAKELF